MKSRLAPSSRAIGRNWMRRIVLGVAALAAIGTNSTARGQAYKVNNLVSDGTVAGSSPTFGFSSSAGAASVRAGASTTLALSAAPVNGFSGNVSLSCSGLPAGANCTFSPAQLSVAANAVALSTVTINTTSASARNESPQGRKGRSAGWVLACLAPMLSVGLLGSRRGRRRSVLLLTYGWIALLFATGLAGCGDDRQITPAGQSQVTIQATSGSVTQQTTVQLVVQ